MKKLFLILISLFLAFSQVNAEYTDINLATGILEKRCFTVSAYYSPLPNQKYFYKEDYEAEIRLNGRGKYGSSGKAVYEGMLAGPNGYDFGTKIFLDGIGIGSIEDRGGAIVSAGNRGYSCDRIDLWMGYGDEGLQRALQWGKKTLDGAILDSDSISETIDLSSFKKGYNESELHKNPNYGLEMELFTQKVGPESSSSDIKKLQEYLKKMGIYSGEINGKYSSLKNEFIDFQIKYSIIENKDSYGAGYYGYKTISLFEAKYFEILEEYSGNVEEKQKELAQQKKDLVVNYMDSYIDNINFIEFNDKSEDTIKIINLLNLVGTYDGVKQKTYNEQVINGVKKYQLNKKIILDENDYGAGYFGPKTKSCIKEDIEIIITELIEKKYNVTL